MKYLLFIGIFSITACTSVLAKQDKFREWQEEVRLNDGRIIVVTQRKRCEGAYTGGNYAPCIAREAWLTINLPEFSDKPIIWHEKLKSSALNIHDNSLYMVARFPTQREFKLYGEPQPPYIGFVWKDNTWQRIPFEAIPEAIYDTNMLIEGIPPEGIKYLSIVKKESKEINGDSTYPKYIKRIDPTHRW